MELFLTEMLQAALVPCDGYMGAFARLNDPVLKKSWPLCVRTQRLIFLDIFLVLIRRSDATRH